MSRHQSGQIDVGERIAAHHQKRPSPQIVRVVLHASGGPEQLGLERVADLHVQRAAVSEVAGDDIREVVQVDDHLAETVTAQEAQDVIESRPIGDGSHGLWHEVRDRPKSRPDAGGHDHDSHSASNSPAGC
jgi:hypothetical protein